MPDIYEQAESFRAALLKQERAAAVRLVNAYGTAWAKLSKQLSILTKEIKDARDRGEMVNQAWLFRQKRYQALIEQITKEIARFADLAEATITKEQRKAVNAARSDARQLLLTAADGAEVASSFNKLPSSAFENLVGFLSDGSPLNSLLGQLAPSARRQVEEGLTNAVAQGWGAQKSAGAIRKALGGNLNRALKIARTETIRAYRESSHRSYQENSDVLDGWIWLSARNARTCAACWAMHGTFHPVTERMTSHVQCRCTQIPYLKPLEGSTRPAIARGEDLFAKLPVKDQREVLGNAFDAYKDGRVKLTDLVGRKDSLQWGTSYYHLSLKRAIAGEGQFPGYKSPPAPIVLQEAVKPRGLSAVEARARLEEVGVVNEAAAVAARVEYDAAAIAEHLAATSPDRTYQGAHYADWRKKKLDMFDKEKALREALNEKLRAVLNQSSPAKFSVGNRKVEPGWAKGIEGFRALIGDGWLDGEKINFKKIRGRANYDLKGNVKVTAWEDASVVVHELGHWLEDKSKSIFDAVSEFMERRTKGERIVGMNKFGNGYRRDEVTKPDEFMNAYMGKQYFKRNGERYASEIVSMGLEYMYSKPLEFARRDPDYFDFIYDLVRKRD